MDFIASLTEDQGCNAIFTCVDKLTKLINTGKDGIAAYAPHTLSHGGRVAICRVDREAFL